MIIDQLFEEEKKKLNEIDPRNYDSDVDYYNDLDHDDEEDDNVDPPEDDDYDPPNDEESHYEKYVRVNNLEEKDMDEGVVGNMFNKAKSMFTKPATAPAAAPAPVVPNAATQARIAAAPQGYDPNTGKPQVAAKTAPGAVAKGGTMDMTKKVAPVAKPAVAPAAPTGNYDPNTGAPISAKGQADAASMAAYNASPQGKAMDAYFAAQDAGTFKGTFKQWQQQQQAQQPAVAEAKRNKQRKLNEAMLMEDPVYRKFKGVGQYIAERRMSEKEILQVFADAESGMTDKATGANRTFLGRGKDTTMDFAGGVADALKGVWGGIQKSVPVEAVDQAWDAATNAMANLTGGQKGAVMQAIKKYRMLAKQYPKTAGLSKAALVAIAGLATGGAGLPAVAALVYGLDSSIKGDKLSDIALKAGGAAAAAWAAGKLFGGDAAADTVTPTDVPPGGVVPTDGGTYTVMQGDQGGFIAQANGVPFKDLQALNPDITNWNKLPVGTELQLPPSGPNTGSVWQGTDMSAPGTGMNPTDVNNFRADNMARMQDQADAAYYAGKPDDFGVPARSNDAVGTGMPGSASSQGFTGTKVAGIPVIPGQPLTATQMAVADMSMQMGNQLSPVVQAAYDLAKRGVVRESIKFKILPAEKLIDQKSTVLSWALNESVGRRSISLNLTTLGTYTVFENVDRYRKAIMELKGVPGSTRPEYYRPDMMDAPTKPDKKPGLIGRGLNWLDKKAGQVGGALSNFGHQFTTNVTKEKLKMNWHQAGKPSDSDQLAAWLTKQGVPQEVVTTVYGKMGIPYVAPASAEPAVDPAAPATEPAKPAAGGAQKSLPFYGTNPTTGKAWTVDQLGATSGTPAPAPGPAPAATSAAAPAPAATGAATPSAEKFPGEDPTGPNYVGRLEVKRRQAARAAAAPAAPAKPNFAQQGGGYGSVNYAPNIKTGANLPKPTTPAAPAGTRVTSGGPTPDEQAKLAQRIAQATAKPVAEMLRMVETKEDVAKIKQFIDQTFVKYGAVTESAFVVRNRLIEHVTQVGAQRRREHARMS